MGSLVITGWDVETSTPILERIKGVFRKNNCPFRKPPFGCKGDLVRYLNQQSLRGGMTIGRHLDMDEHEMFQFSCSYCPYTCVASSMEQASNPSNIGPSKRVWLEKLASDVSMQHKFKHVRIKQLQ